MAHCELHYLNEALGIQSTAQVIIPEGAHRPPYPVLYLLHGLSDDSTAWMRWTNIERYVADLPLMVVMPEGGRGFYSDAVAGFACETALVRDLIGMVDRTFQTRAERSGRCLCGNSMGGYGAFRLALRHPDKFCAAVSLSGAMGFAQRPAGEITEEIARILGPNPIGSEYDLFALAEKACRETLPALRFDCGVGDFLLEENRAFREHLEKLGLPHEYEESPGLHNWDYWDLHVRSAIAFFRKHLAL